MSYVTGSGEGPREVAVFRHNLFKISEPFITEQAQHLRRYRPLYVGRLRFGRPPEGARSVRAPGPLQKVCAAAHRVADDHRGLARVLALARAPASVVDPCAFRRRGRLCAAVGGATRHPPRHHVPWVRCDARDARDVGIASVVSLSAVAPEAGARGGTCSCVLPRSSAIDCWRWFSPSRARTFTISAWTAGRSASARTARKSR